MTPNKDERSTSIPAATNSAMRPGQRPVVIAMHCSGADGNQWRKLAQKLEPRFEVVAPSFIGADPMSRWHGQHRFRLADEVKPLLELIDACTAPVHLVGHSYGGAAALRVAASRPECIASVSLYEPSAFHLLRQLGQQAEAELCEIEDVARSLVDGLSNGAYVQAASEFVDYWNGAGCWASLREPVRALLVRWLPHAALHFHALFCEATPLAAMRFSAPLLVVRGEHARPPSRLLADLLASEIGGRSAECVPRAGHMGPVTHAETVNALIANHIATAQAVLPSFDLHTRNAA